MDDSPNEETSKLIKQCLGKTDVLEELQKGERNYSSDYNPKEIHSVDNDSKQFNILMKNIDKWNCSACGYNNSFEVDCCEICFSNQDEFGSWLCKHCTCISIGRANKCVACQFENKSITSSIENSTKAGKGKPTLENSRDNAKKADPKNNEKTGGGVNPNKNNANQSNKNKPTAVLGAHASMPKSSNPNDQSDSNWVHVQSLPASSNNSKNTMKTASNDVPDPSKCWNQNCKQPLDFSDQFCKSCKLDIRGSYECTKQFDNKNKTKMIWVCKQCHRYNDFHVSKCKCGVEVSKKPVTRV